VTEKRRVSKRRLKSSMNYTRAQIISSSRSFPSSPSSVRERPLSRTKIRELLT